MNLFVSEFYMFHFWKSFLWGTPPEALRSDTIRQVNVNYFALFWEKFTNFPFDQQIMPFRGFLDCGTYVKLKHLIQSNLEISLKSTQT